VHDRHPQNGSGPDCHGGELGKHVPAQEHYERHRQHGKG
jgi:hypothetical protein